MEATKVSVGDEYEFIIPYGQHFYFSDGVPDGFLPEGTRVVVEKLFDVGGYYPRVRIKVIDTDSSFTMTREAFNISVKKLGESFRKVA